MLISFKFSNYLSFKDASEFTMLPTKERQHRNRIYNDGKFKLLPIAGIYGGNGAGKSNFFEALKFARWFILYSGKSPDNPIEIEPFRLFDSDEELPTYFSFKILIDRKVMDYEFSVNRQKVLTEKLSESKNGDVFKIVYSRNLDEWNLSSLKDSLGNSEDKAFLDFKSRDTLSNQLFLTALRGRKIALVESVLNWFSKTLTLLTPSSTKDLVVYADQKEILDYSSDILKRSDVGIDNIEGEVIPFDQLNIPTSAREKLKKEALSLDQNQVLDVKFSRESDMSNPSRCSIDMENGQLRVKQLVTYHATPKGKRVRFDISDESQGTQCLIDLLPEFYHLHNSDHPKVLVIDEIDRSLHHLLVKNLITSFLDNRETTDRSQLIFTTHDGLLLDQDIFRRDELWFVDKKEAGNSNLTSLSDFEDIRYDKDILKSYLLGRFGGIPLLRPYKMRSKGLKNEAAR